MYYIILLILLILSIMEKYCKNKKIIFFLSISILAGISIFNQWSPDILSYKEIYKNIEYINKQPDLKYEYFFMKTALIFLKLGFSFIQFKMFYILLSILIFAYFLYKKTKYPSFIIFNFYLIPYYLNLVQIRQWLGLMILMMLLFYQENKKLLYIGIILLPLFHISLFVFYGYIIIDYYDLYSFFSKLYIFLIIMIIIILLPKNIIIIILKFIGGRYIVYGEISRKLYGTLILVLPYFVINLILIKKTVKHKKFNMYAKIAVYSNLLIIPTIIIRDFMRIIMNLNLFVLVYLTNKYKKNTKVRILIIISSLFLFYFEFLMINNGEYFEVIKKTIESFMK